MKSVPTLLRIAEHEALARMTLSGSIIDLGGDARGEYRGYLPGEHTFTTVNLAPHALPDITHDLETPLPCADASFDHALLINVLEHVYHARALLQEAVRVVRPGGSLVVIVPFLFPLHEDPHDFWRFSRETLERMCAEAGLQNVRITPLGSGIFAARYVMLDRLLPFPVRLLMFYTLRFQVWVADAVFTRLAHKLGKKYQPADYALGYAVEAHKT
jgi:SAM-dependent methyltransferase